MIDKPVVLITGAGRGLGREMALAFSKNGFAVGINYSKSEKEANGTANDIKKNGGKAIVLKADVRFSKDVESIVKMIQLEWGRVDVLINNAGISADRTVFKMKDDEWKSVLGVNLDGPFFCSRAVLPMMREQKSGHIINIISYLVKSPAVGAANYAASKAGLLALTKSIALEEGRFNIQVNAVMPGFHITDMNKKVFDRYEKTIRDQHVIKTLPKKEDLAQFIFNLTQFKNISGQEFPFESRIF